ncbi:MAG: sodium/solute symporter [Planctomycetes bacterium]|nr:sodium/solute symporter [Planctomycetota bacterium]
MGSLLATNELQGLHWVDWGIIAIYAVSTIGLGWYYSRRQKSTEEYFVGSGNMNPILVGISLFATLLSTISYLSMSGEALGKGPMQLTGIFAMPLIYVIVAYGLLPVYMRHRVTSAYELLELKLGLSVRMLGAVMFVTLRLVWMSLLVFLAARAMTIMLGIPEQDKAEWIPTIVLVTGFVSVIYTSLGGFRAVVITDLMQTILLFGGAVLVIVMVTIDFEGFSWFPTTWQENWDRQPFFPASPKTRVTVIGTIFTGLTWTVCTAGGDQTAVQRFMATRDAKAARQAYATNMLVGLVVSLTLAMVGFALLAYFQTHPEVLPATWDLKQNADDMFPRYIAYHLPIGVSGLVVAAMFAAAMSSIDSGVNSITAVVTTDFLDRFGLRPKTERAHVRIAQILAFSIGAIVVIGSSYVGLVKGNITAVTQKTTNLLVTPIFALFFFALFVPFARPKGVWVGAVCGTATAILLAFSGPIVQWLAVNHGVDPATFGTEWVLSKNQETGVMERGIVDPVSFQWIGPVALFVNLLTGTVVSLLVAKKK